LARDISVNIQTGKFLWRRVNTTDAIGIEAFGESDRKSSSIRKTPTQKSRDIAYFESPMIDSDEIMDGCFPASYFCVSPFESHP
jgi:hypothetical protein